jgi:predicted house-cleaning noncanonical NTP pyrophosphatase (MazG superfamily)
VKLVRDRIPELAAGTGQPGAFGQADPAEYGRLLRAKLLEEAAEAASAPGPAELLAELGDVLQILYALAADAGLAAAEIECARARKARTRGSFTRRVVWHDPSAREDT